MTIVQALGSFALLAALLTIIPGVDTTLVLRSPDAARNEAARAEVEALIHANHGKIIPVPTI